MTVFYSLQDFLRHVYPPELISQAVSDHHAFTGRAILAVRNDNVAAINSNMLANFPGHPVELVAVDSAEVEDATMQDSPPVEPLQSFEPPSLPPSRLLLKIGVPVMLLRNLYPTQGLCNST